MSALVEDVIAVRDALKTKDIRMSWADRVLADAANALDSYEKTMRVIAEGGPAPIEWETVAEEALGVMKAAADVAAKKAADEIYERLLCSTQDYLEENLRFNIASTLDTAERERKAAQDRVKGLLAANSKLISALVGIAEDTDPENPSSYRCDDREGCLDAVQARARTAIKEAQP